MAGRTLPATEDSLLVRTSFADPDAWRAARAAATAENADGFRAYVQVVDDPAWDGATVAEIRGAALTGVHASVLFVVDALANEPDYPILVVDLGATGAEPFRCIARELWSVDNNLNLANMDWHEFASSTGPDGVYRGPG